MQPSFQGTSFFFLPFISNCHPSSLFYYLSYHSLFRPFFLLPLFLCWFLSTIRFRANYLPICLPIIHLLIQKSMSPRLAPQTTFSWNRGAAFGDNRSPTLVVCGRLQILVSFIQLFHLHGFIYTHDYRPVSQ